MNSKRIEEEYKRLVEDNGWRTVYQNLGVISSSYEYTQEAANKHNNKPLNRYRDVNPFDHSRVILQRPETDYINANHVVVARANRKYILTQGPLVYSIGHFWCMVWEQGSQLIVMLNKLVEKNELKCHWYWPRPAGEPDDFDVSQYGLKVTHLWEEKHKFYTVRTFMIAELATRKERLVIQFHYTTWPDFDVPASPDEFLEFLNKIRETGFLDKPVPAIVHCSAGIGRSGTFCLVDAVLLLVQREGQENINIQEILLEMRKYRMGLIQTSEQLRFSYLAIIEGVRRLDPNYVPTPMEEVEYVPVANDDEEAPPPPPPRGESLGGPPARPLPAIPASTSHDCVGSPKTVSSDEEGAVLISSDEDGEAAAAVTAEQSATSKVSLEKAALRRRRIEDMTERIATMKKRSLEADSWHSVKRAKSVGKEQQRKPDA